MIIHFQNVSIPNSVIEIGTNTFSFCSSLTSIIIPNSVTKIGDLAFSFCSSLTSIIIPNNNSEIGFHAFPEKCKVINKE